MKKRFRKEFHREFPWYDHTFLLEAMILWLNNASKRHRDDRHLVRSHRTTKQLRIVSGVLRRIIDDNYDAPNKVFISRNRKIEGYTKIFGEDGYTYLDFKWQEKHRQADIDFAFDMMKKWLLGWWD
ncbi:hypothetical protein TUST1-15_00140 [Vibrio phage ICP1_2005_A]|nr:hypothetical protein TUST1-15_00140 [Vibrio phage ICP1_2005_A]